MRLFNLGLAAIAVVTSVIPLGTAAAEPPPDYPQRPVTLLIGAPPGGEVDALARLLAEHLGQDLGQRVIIEHKPGAAMNIAGEAAARSKPDGYTIFIGGRANTLHKVMYPSIKYDFARDLAPLGLIGTTTPILVAGMHTQINSVHDLLRMAKERPGELTYGSVGVGTNSHMIFELLRGLWGVALNHVPYRGSAAAITDMIGGRIDVQISVPAAVLPYIQAGKLRPLAVLSPTRLSALPDVPTLGELGVPGTDYRIWAGLLVPAGTPPEIVERLNKSLNVALNNPEMVKSLSQSGMDPAAVPISPVELKELIASETELWTEILRKHGVAQAE